MKGLSKACDWVSGQDAINTAGVCTGKTAVDSGDCVDHGTKASCISQKNWAGVAQCNWEEMQMLKDARVIVKQKSGIVHDKCGGIVDESGCTSEKDWLKQDACDWVNTGAAIGTTNNGQTIRIGNEDGTCKTKGGIMINVVICEIKVLVKAKKIG